MLLLPTEADDRFMNESIKKLKHKRAKAVCGTARTYIYLYTAVTNNCFFIYRQVFH
jgi:hypothetical protein